LPGFFLILDALKDIIGPMIQIDRSAVPQEFEYEGEPSYRSLYLTSVDFLKEMREDHNSILEEARRELK